ncbi:MAG: hypothetical protein JWP63_6292 [Candidatus Solibacter sp.]|nr:hypothetical protein [Candidatus Solibacter sp.]
MTPTIDLERLSRELAQLAATSEMSLPAATRVVFSEGGQGTVEHTGIDSERLSHQLAQLAATSEMPPPAVTRVVFSPAGRNAVEHAGIAIRRSHDDTDD